MATRRRFLKAAAQGVACAACSSPLAACGDAGDAPPLEQDVELTLADYPDLTADGGLIELGSDVTGYDYPIFVRNEGDGRFTALAGFCNHEGCSVRPQGDGFECPCHGARFAGSGTLRDGPATADLASFETQSDGTTLLILAE